jgi:CDP-diacylglycerol--glycerol-3-phosphate 3-phosphatidyltransferase
MLNNDGARRAVSGIVDPLARGLLALRLTPDAVTLIGTVGTCVAALVFFPRGDFIVGVVVIAVFVLFDLLDGAMARLSGSSGPWGNFLDSTLDRVADGAVFGGVLLWAALRGDAWTAGATLAALVAGQVTSYAKARAESVGATANVGIIERAERILILLAAALIAGFGPTIVLVIAVWLLAVVGSVTVIQRIVVVRRQLRPRTDTTG